MRLISWNCNGALRNKLHKVLPLDADICVIQECEDPAQSKSDDHKTWAGNYLWTGTNKNRGLGICQAQYFIDCCPSGHGTAGALSALHD